MPCLCIFCPVFSLVLEMLEPTELIKSDGGHSATS